MDFKLIKLSAFVAKGVSGKINHVHCNDFSGNLQVIPKLWAELNAYIGKNNIQKFSAIDESLDYFAGVIVNTQRTVLGGP